MSTGTLAALDGVTPREYSERLDEDAIVIPVGLEFNPNWISVSFSTDHEELCSHTYFTGVLPDQVYRDFYEEALNKKVQSHVDSKDFSPSVEPLVSTEERASELVLVFAIHIENAWKMAVWSLDEDPKLDFKVMAITLPDHWDASARTVVAKAARKAGHPLDGSYMMITLPRAVKLASEMHKDAPGNYLTLLIHYHESYLHLMLVKMCGTGCVMERQVCLRHLGEDEIEASNGGSATLNKTYFGGNLSHEEPSSDQFPNEEPPNDNPLHNNTIYESLNELPPDPSISTYFTDDDTASGNDLYTESSNDQHPPVDLKPIQEALTKFILLMKPTDDSNPAEELSLHFKHAVRDVKYMFIDGEASSRGRTALLTAINEMFADAKGINFPRYLTYGGVSGARIAARQQFQNPMHLGNWEDLPGYLSESTT